MSSGSNEMLVLPRYPPISSAQDATLMALTCSSQSCSARVGVRWHHAADMYAGASVIASVLTLSSLTTSRANMLKGLQQQLRVISRLFIVLAQPASLAGS